MNDPFAETTVTARRAVIVMAIVVAGSVALGLWRPTVLGTIAVILAFFVMILLHEAGHFVVAKRAGMKVTEFFVGFGPRLWSVQRGETEYGVKALPLGGYCKIIGMTNLDDVDPADEPRAYRSKGYGARMAVAVAGSVVHFLIAIVLMFAVIVGAGDLRRSTPVPVADVVEHGQPAAAAGLRPGDRIVSIAGMPISTWDQLSRVVRDHPGQTVTFVVDRGGQQLALPVSLDARNPQGDHVGYAGIAPQLQVPHVSVVTAAVRAPVEVYDVGRLSVVALGQIFSPSGIHNYLDNLSGQAPKGSASNDRFLSPVGFGRVANQAVDAGWVATLGLLIAINVFVGIFNLVPLLPFDGGHVAIATYERLASLVRHRRVQVDVAKLMPLTVGVLAILGFIFLSSLFLDVSRPIQNPF